MPADDAELVERRRLYQAVILLFGVACIATAFFTSSYPAQDAVAFVAGTELALEGSTGGYPTTDVGFSPEFREVFCELEAQCEEYIVPFISPPPMVYLMAPIVATGAPVLVIRLLGALSIALGTWLLFRTLPTHLVRAYAVSTLLAAPIMVRGIELGQNSQWLYLALVVGLGGPSIARALLVAAGAIAKVTPLVVGLALVTERDWRGIAVIGSLLAVASLAAFGLPEGFPTYLERMEPFSQAAAIKIDNVSPTRLIGPAWLVLVAVSTALAYRWLGHQDRWALLWMVWVVAIPLVWTHYLWVAFGALWWLVGQRLGSEKLAFVLAAWCVLGVYLEQLNYATKYWLVATWIGLLAVLYLMDSPTTAAIRSQRNEKAAFAPTS